MRNHGCPRHYEMFAISSWFSWPFDRLNCELQKDPPHLESSPTKGEDFLVDRLAIKHAAMTFFENRRFKELAFNLLPLEGEEQQEGVAVGRNRASRSISKVSF